MAASKFKKLNLGDHELMRFQDSVAESFDRILGLPILNSILIAAEKDSQGNLVPLSLSGTFKLVEHGLGRKPLGWVLVSPSADARVWEDQTVATAALLAAANCNPDPAKFLRLKASAAVNCRILVF